MSLDTISALRFAGISDDELVFLQNDYDSCQQQKFHQFDELKFQSFKYSDYSAHDQESNIDPENNFYNYISSNCKYYSDQQFNEDLCVSQSVVGGSLSFVNFNVRSLNGNFENICIYLESLNIAFSIIAISETWAETDQTSPFHLSGYTSNHVLRCYKHGGGVALYVKDSLDCSITSSKSTAITNVLLLI